MEEAFTLEIIFSFYIFVGHYLVRMDDIDTSIE